MQTELTPAEIIARGHAIYEAHIKELPEDAKRGDFFMVDLDSGDCEIGSDEEQFELSARLRARHPNAQLYFLRVGARATYSLGGTL